MTFMSAEQTWQATIRQLKNQMTLTTFNTWIKNTRLVAYSDDNYTIGVTNTYAKDWLENRLLGTIKKTLSNMAGNSVHIDFVVVPYENSNAPSKKEVYLMQPESFDSPEPEKKKRPSPRKNGNGNNNNGNGHQLGASIKLSRNYTFNRFVVGAGNRLAYAAAKSVSEKPGTAYNPLFLYGGVGLGKTHLLQAIAHSANNNNQRVIYVSSETFTNDFINAIRRQTTDSFREYYRSADYLLIDDIHFIAGKESTQEEFFHTFNDIHSAGRQIVLASDRLPRAIPTLEKRLRSRFEWGLITDIQPPDLETRIAILQFKAQQVGANVPNEVMDFIARRAQSNIRELEGALNKVVAHASLMREEITIELAKNALQNLVDRRKSITVAMVIDVVSDFFGITIEELKSNGRSKRIAGPRHMAMYLAREETTASLPQIGESLGNRDHTTIMYGYEKIAKLVETDDHIRKEAMQLREKLYQKLS